MTEQELAKEIKNGTVSGVYFFYGEEDYTKNHRAASICNLVSGGDMSLAAFNVIKLRFDDRGVDMSKVSDAMLSPPLMSPMKAVHVHIAFVDAMSEKEKTALVEQVTEYAGEDFSYPLAEGETVTLVLPGAFVYAPIPENADAGYAHILIDGQPVGKVALYYGETVERADS